MLHGSLREWLVPGAGLADRMVIDGRKGSFKREKCSGGGQIEREENDCGFRCDYDDGVGTGIIVEQTPDHNLVSLGTAMIARYDRAGKLMSVELSLLLMALSAARAGVREALRVSEGLEKMAEAEEDFRMIADFNGERPGLTFVRANLKETCEIAGGNLFEPPEIIQGDYEGSTPLLGMAICVFQDDDFFYAAIKDNDQAFIHVSRNKLDSKNFRYDMSASEMVDLRRTAFPVTGIVRRPN